MDNGASSYRRFLDGDESAFNEIMEELFRSLVFFINGYVHDIHAAEDIAIDAFSDLVVHRHRYNFKVTLKTYVFMLGRSRALDYIKHRKVLSFVELSEAEGVEDEKTLEEIVLADERKRTVHSAIAKLSEDMRVVIHMPPSSRSGWCTAKSTTMPRLTKFSNKNCLARAMFSSRENSFCKAMSKLYASWAFFPRSAFSTAFHKV